MERSCGFWNRQTCSLILHGLEDTNWWVSMIVLAKMLSCGTLCHSEFQAAFLVFCSPHDASISASFALTERVFMAIGD